MRPSIRVCACLLAVAACSGSHEDSSKQQRDAARAQAGGSRATRTGALSDDADAGAVPRRASQTARPDRLDAGDAKPSNASDTPAAGSGGPAPVVDDSMAGMPPPGMTPLFPLMPKRPECVPDDLDAGVDGDDDDAGTRCVPPPPDCTDKPGAPGTTTRMYEGRSYIVHVPPGASPNTPLPVMFVFHGAGGTGEQMQAATGFDGLADQVGLVTVYPNGEEGNAPWNVGRNVCPPGNFVSTTQDDVAYVEHMLSDVASQQCIDKRRVFATGFSMGGYFSNELGCRIGRTTLRAIAPHSGGAHPGACPGAPLPVLLLHGDSDSLISYQCGENARDYWIERNGCSSEYDRLDITGGHCDFYRACPASAPVVLCTFNGLDHAWAYPPMYESSGGLIWLFFSQFF